MKKLSTPSQRLCWFMAGLMLILVTSCRTQVASPSILASRMGLILAPTTNGRTQAASPNARASGRAVVQTQDQLEAMEKTADLGRNLFFKQDYAAARERILPLTAEMHASKPLYECELASIALLAGDKAEAGERLRGAISLLEDFFDKDTERKALSQWGHEGEKVYKGNPCERALIYTFHGMDLLERGEVDNALAAFKRALLMGGDKTMHEYRANFGIVPFLAAKCHDLLGEPELRDLMLGLAFQAAISINLPLDMAAVKQSFDESIRDQRVKQITNDNNSYKRFLETTAGGKNDTSIFFKELGGMTQTNGFARAIQMEYDLFGQSGDAPSPWIATLASWGGMGRVKELGNLSDDILAWLERHLPADKGMNFNTVVVGWDGYGPAWTRYPLLESQRMIAIGEKPDERLTYSVAFESTSASGLQWLANITHQTLFQGFNAMDAVRMVQDRMVDIRNWQCLPQELILMPLTLPEGANDVTVASWFATQPKAEKKISVNRAPNAAVTFAHLALPENTSIPTRFANRVQHFQYAAASGEIDLDHDGEISPDEKRQATEKALMKYDVDQDRMFSAREMSLAEKQVVPSQNDLIKQLNRPQQPPRMTYPAERTDWDTSSVIIIPMMAASNKTLTDYLKEALVKRGYTVVDLPFFSYGGFTTAAAGLDAKIVTLVHQVIQPASGKQYIGNNICYQIFVMDADTEALASPSSLKTFYVWSHSGYTENPSDSREMTAQKSLEMTARGFENMGDNLMRMPSFRAALEPRKNK